MLSKNQRRSVVRVLTQAYFANRNLPLLQVCRKSRIRLWSDPKDAFGGSFKHLPNPDEVEPTYQKKSRSWWNEIYKKYRHQINIPGKRGTPADYKEYVFWHEFCHFVLDKLHLMPRLIGYQGDQQRYNDAENYWLQERLCDAFADAMLLYRRGLVERIEPSLETFLFEDETSIGHAEAAAFCTKRIQRYVNKAAAAKRKIDLRGLQKFLAHQGHYIAGVGFQQELPTNYYDSHREPYMHYVETEEPYQPSLHHGKPSWRERHPQELRLLARMNALREAKDHPQLVLFQECALDDKKEFERELELLDRAVQRFQNDKPRS